MGGPAAPSWDAANNAKQPGLKSTLSKTFKDREGVFIPLHLSGQTGKGKIEVGSSSV